MDTTLVTMTTRGHTLFLVSKVCYLPFHVRTCVPINTMDTHTRTQTHTFYLLFYLHKFHLAGVWHLQRSCLRIWRLFALSGMERRAKIKHSDACQPVTSSIINFLQPSIN